MACNCGGNKTASTEKWEWTSTDGKQKKVFSAQGVALSWQKSFGGSVRKVS